MRVLQEITAFGLSLASLFAVGTLIQYLTAVSKPTIGRMLLGLALLFFYVYLAGRGLLDLFK